MAVGDRSQFQRLRPLYLPAVSQLLFLHADWPVDLRINEIWDVPADTFKNKAIVEFGSKENAANLNPVVGRRVFADALDESCEYHLLHQGRRTAWSSNPTAQDITEGVLDCIPFLQGADIMPRTLVFQTVFIKILYKLS